MVREEQTLVRRPEQGTGPNVHYKGVEASCSSPARRSGPTSYLWSDRPPQQARDLARPGCRVLTNTRVVLDAGHRSSGAGRWSPLPGDQGHRGRRAMLAPFAVATGARPAGRGYAGTVALVFTAASRRPRWCTTSERPRALLRLLYAAEHGVVAGEGRLDPDGVRRGDALAASLRMARATTPPRTAALGERRSLGLAAGYTAFLFAQCKGRDLWQAPWLLPHSARAGGVGRALACSTVPCRRRPSALSMICAARLVALHAGVACCERSGPQDQQRAAGRGVPGDGAARLAAAVGGGDRARDRDGCVCSAGGAGVRGVWVLIGLYLYKWAYVRAGQLPPLS